MAKTTGGGWPLKEQQAYGALLDHLGACPDCEDATGCAVAQELRAAYKAMRPARDTGSAYGLWREHIRTCPVCTGGVGGACGEEARLWLVHAGLPTGGTRKDGAS
ncbi:hypothetical protein [Streptomyces sp. NPDC001978]|uniref:hypothetical protein n=1 Tax=Streptomyces sp. NPDC001978 TaxID=3364627 RepID=UPI0036CA51E4